jgi:uncharacterized delta-60 repeat protein
LLSAGQLDTTFGGNGTVITNATTVTASEYQTQYASGVVIQPDLKTVVAGVTPETYKVGHTTVTYLDMVVARYNTDGSLDSTFGNSGLVLIRANVDWWDSTVPHLTSVALEANGDIVVAGTTDVTYSSGKHGTVTRHDLYVARLNPNGSFDTSFNGTGSEVIDFPQGDVLPVGVAIHSSGKIDIGADSGASGLHFLAVQLNPNGGLDSTFGPSGEGYVGLASGSADQMILDGSGRILISGSDNNMTAVVRYTASGLPDSSFGNNGESIINLGFSLGAYGIGVQSTGQIVLSGDVVIGGVFAGGGVAALNPDGSVDTSFGSSGVFIDSTFFHPYAVTVQPNDEVLVAGKGGASAYGYIVDRLTASGQIDTTFGTNGQAQAFFSGAPDANPHAMTLGPDGRITVTGVVNFHGGVNPNQLGTARFLNDISAPSSMTTTTAAPAPASQPTFIGALDPALFTPALDRAARAKGSGSDS